jgi:hypothetical protein
LGHYFKAVTLPYVLIETLKNKPSIQFVGIYFNKGI